MADMTPQEEWRDEVEREQAGASYCADSAKCICLVHAACIDMRYGDIVLLVDVPDGVELTGFDGDFWAADSEACPIADAEEIRCWQAIPASNIKISKRYTHPDAAARLQ